VLFDRYGKNLIKGRTTDKRKEKNKRHGCLQVHTISQNPGPREEEEVASGISCHYLL